MQSLKLNKTVLDKNFIKARHVIPFPFTCEKISKRTSRKKENTSPIQSGRQYINNS